ncbi:hypothetical protein ALQ30_200637 [Pseudomonas syringae pv. persicae]|uniref:Uncharacterized protein n=1 Tax=Pseudomonas syringae pv. persicae TaxID=237306 RepID=A0A3M3ZV03_9PSED|nr:hypothetical protein ALQ30_200637 [Pseudomonas syringae pv. persicae]
MHKLKTDVVIQRVAQGEPHERTQWRVIRAHGQKIVETLPVELFYVNTKLAAPIRNPAAQHCVIR